VSIVATSVVIPNAGGRRLCSVCVLEEFLSAWIEKDGTDGTCFYCGFEGKSFSVDEIATSVSTILADCYSRLEPPTGVPLKAVIDDLALVCADAAEDIRTVLAERHAAEWGPVAPDDNPFGPNACYSVNSSIDTWDFEHGWLDFEKNLKTEARYFNRQAEFWLASIFDGIDTRRTIFGQPVIVDAGPGTDFSKLFRARVFQSESELREAMKRPDVEIGPPAEARERRRRRCYG
jgi:hypothetical protein